LTDSGPLRSIEIEGVVARLPRHIAAREIECASTELAEVSATKGIDVVKKIRELEPEVGPGNILSITVRREAVTEVFTGFGIRGVPAEQVGREAAMACRRYVEAGVAVGEHLADQLLLPLALSGGGRFTATALSPHARTNSAVILQFLSIPISSRPFGEHGVLVQVGEEG
jgi:RNA 3'-terminal phosphate cyclase (ATP)